jgi:hemolysin activation/secretion protein
MLQNRSLLQAVILLAAVPALAVPQATPRAQPASQITPRSFAPPAQTTPPVGGLRIEAAPGLETPPGADRVFVTLGGVLVTGGFADLAPAEARTRARLVGRKLSGAEIFAAARDLEAAYASAGYVLARVVLPPQGLNDGGQLRLTVIDGFIERVDTQAVPQRVRAWIERVVAPLVRRPRLRLRELERRILLAGDTPGVLLRSTLAAGSDPGATVLVLQATHQPVSATLSVDNTLASELGREQAGLFTTLNSVAGHGEQVYLGLTGDPFAGSNGLLAHYPRNRVLVAGLILPINTNGLSFNIEATQAITTPLAGPAGGSTDKFERLSLRLREPWVRGRDLNLSSQVIFDIQDEQDNALDDAIKTPISLDRLRVLRLANDASYIDGWGGTLSGTLTASFGLDVLGARTASEARPSLPLSTQGANATFSKIDGTLAYTQPLATHLATSVSLRGQTSFNTPLEHAEQVGITGPGGLSAFDVGTFQGDSGVVGRIELAAPWPLPRPVHGVGLLISPYLFGAAGEVVLAQPTAQEVGSTRAAAYGIGVRLGGGVGGALSNGQIALEFGRQARSNSGPADNRITLTAALTF